MFQFENQKVTYNLRLLGFIEIHSFIPVGEHYCYFGQIKDKIHQKNDLQLSHIPCFWKDNCQVKWFYSLRFSIFSFLSQF